MRITNGIVGGLFLFQATLFTLSWVITADSFRRYDDHIEFLNLEIEELTKDLKYKEQIKNWLPYERTHKNTTKMKQRDYRLLQKRARG